MRAVPYHFIAHTCVRSKVFKSEHCGLVGVTKVLAGVLGEIGPFGN